MYRQSTKQDTENSVQQMYVDLALERAGIVPGGGGRNAGGLRLADVGAAHLVFDHLRLVLSGRRRAGVHERGDAGCLGFRRAGILTNSINIEHYHDLGKWLFALTAFYTYIAFSQYLLIWYANIPEETQFYRASVRTGAWLYISLALPFIRFFIPFFVLLCRPAKRNLTIIGMVAGWSIVMEFWTCTGW